MRLTFLKKIGTRNGIETFEEGTKPRKVCIGASGWGNAIEISQECLAIDARSWRMRLNFSRRNKSLECLAIGVRNEMENFKGTKCRT